MQAIVGRSRSLVFLQLKPTTIRVANCSNIANYVPEIRPPVPLPGNLRTFNLKSSFQSDATELNKQVAFNVFKSASEKRLLESFKKRYEAQMEHIKNLKKERRKLSSQYVDPHQLGKKIAQRQIKFEEDSLIVERDLDEMTEEQEKETPQNAAEERIYYFKQRFREDSDVPMEEELVEEEQEEEAEEEAVDNTSTALNTASTFASSATTTDNTATTTPSTTTSVITNGTAESSTPTTSSSDISLIGESTEILGEEDKEKTEMEWIQQHVEQFDETFEHGDWEDYVPHPIVIEDKKTYWDDKSPYDQTLSQAGVNTFIEEQIKDRKFALYLEQNKGGYQQALEYLDKIEEQQDPDMFNKTTLKAARFAGDYNASEFTEIDTENTQFNADIERLETDEDNISEETLQRLMQVKMARFGLHVPPTPGQFELVADNLIKKIEECASDDKKLFLVNILRKHLTSIYSPDGKIIVSSHKWFPKKQDPKVERKIHLKVKVSSLGLPPAVRSRLLEMVEFRYDPTTDILTLVGDDLSTKSSNRHLVKKTLAALLHEAWKVHDSYVSLEPIPTSIDLNDSSFLQQIPENYSIFHVTP